MKRTNNKKRLELTKQKVKDLTGKDLERVAGGQPQVHADGLFSGDACITGA